MNVQVKDRLADGGPIVDNETSLGMAQLLRDLDRRQHEVTEQGGIVTARVAKRCNRLARHHEDM